MSLTVTCISNGFLLMLVSPQMKKLTLLHVIMLIFSRMTSRRPNQLN